METLESRTQMISITQARRIGGFSFLMAASIQMLLVIVFFLILVWLDFKLGLRGIIYHESYPFLHHVRRNILWDNLAISFGTAMVPFIVLSLWLGRWAGRKIISNRSSFILIGALTMQFTALVATLFGTVAISLYLYRNPSFDPAHNPKNMVESILNFVLAIHIPGIIFGILAGLFTRQMGRKALEKLQAESRNSPT